MCKSVAHLNIGVGVALFHLQPCLLPPEAVRKGLRVADQEGCCELLPGGVLRALEGIVGRPRVPFPVHSQQDRPNSFLSGDPSVPHLESRDSKGGLWAGTVRVLQAKASI